MSNTETINIIRVSDSPEVYEYRIHVYPSNTSEKNATFTRIESQEIRRLLDAVGWSQGQVQHAMESLQKHGQLLAWNVSVPDSVLSDMGLR